MQRRSQKLEITLDIQAVSCPGVWLSSRGTTYLSICILGHHIQTREAAPVFPLMFHEKFIIEKVFSHVFQLAELDDILDREVVYIELVQRAPLQPDTVLASFETSAREFLFPNITTTPQYSGADLDLLMEPTVHFPGSLSPRLEVSTKTTAKEVRTSMCRSPARRATRHTSPGRSDGAVVKAAPQSPPTPRRPPFVWRRADTALLGRQPGAPSGRRPPALPRSRSLGALAGTGRGRHCHCACAQRPRSASAERASRAPAATGSRQRSRSLERPDTTGAGAGAVTGRSELHMPPDWCYVCGAYTTHHRCAVCEAYRRYFGRNYPGHHHLDCCNCYCPVTAPAPRYSSRWLHDSDCSSDDSSAGRPWLDPPPPVGCTSQRQAYYQNMEQLYRRLYLQAARRARREALAS
ncbi:spermatogenesis-associated protein 6-like isoform X1 [Amphibalanus amphitrite]|uniref:spermatogenesis-associated protein 6-like isoform X1 n=2 Tax=Amphibalanus amphitrite TaxID=1232801 RepID=UPI001C912849|nr:spermatogenesis-associated protein 6-like isoform X1 [Amphibalanus amphitrite]